MWTLLTISLGFFLLWGVASIIVWAACLVYPFLDTAHVILQELRVPESLIPLLLYFPHLLVVIFYYLFCGLSKSVAFKSWKGWAYFRRNMVTRGDNSQCATPHTSRQVIYAVCPHGIFAEGVIFYFVLNERYLEVDVMSSTVQHVVPILREFSKLGGAHRADSETIADSLDRGRSIMLLPEGIRGAIYPPDLRVLRGIPGECRRRDGFIRLALTSKNAKDIAIQPVWMDGVDQMYQTWHFFKWFQKLTLKTFGWPWFIFNLGVYGSFFPHTDVPVEVRFGELIELKKKSGELKTTDEVFDEYVREMEKLMSLKSRTASEE